MDRAAIQAFMAGERYAVLSSVAQDGVSWTPQSALVGIAVTPKLEVVFDTLQSSRKYRNLQRSPECSLVIGLGGGSVQQVTVQLQGVAWKPSRKELAPYLEAYLACWPEGRDRLTWPGIAHLVVRPSWIRYSDFSQIPAVVDEFRLPE